jgi:uncharacterized protein
MRNKRTAGVSNEIRRAEAMDQEITSNDMTAQNRILLALEKGTVKISGEKSEGQTGAIIRPGNGVTLFLNNRQITESAEVFPGDRIEIKPAEELKTDLIEVKISSDGLKAEARYTPGIRIGHTIMDHPFTDDLVVEGKPFNEQLITLAAPDLLKAIRNERVVFGFDESAISRLTEESGCWHVVATGTDVRQGRDGWIEPLFEGGMKTVKYGEEEDRVDFRKRFEINQVVSEDVIAIIHPPRAGEPGRKVTGEEIQPDPVKRAEVNCESGTGLTSDKSGIVATRKGVPSYRKGRMHSFRVDDVYIQKGDVDIKSGNVYFRGHFNLHGGIAEGMNVAADGNIEIAENASGAEILAGGNILFKGNCIKCKVQAGWVDLVLKDIYATLDQMAESVDNAIEASEEVARALEQKGKHSEQMEAAVVRALLQSKFTELPEYAVKLLKNLREAGRSLPEKLVLHIKDIAPYFIDFQYSQSLGRPVLKEIKVKLTDLKDGREAGVEKADITAPYIQNSSLLCTGDIIVPGPGVYNSQLKCGGEVKIARLFRGGSIEAGSDVYIGEAGTHRITADQGLIQVPYKGRVHLGTVYENIRIRFGATEYRCEKNLSNVRLILDQQEFEVKILHWEK